MRPSSANHWNAALIEEYYAKWQADPASVDDKWSAFFEGFSLGCAVLPKAGDKSAQTAAAATPVAIQSVLWLFG